MALPPGGKSRGVMDESEPNFILDERLCQRSYLSWRMQFLGARFNPSQKKDCKKEERIGSLTHFPSDTTPLPVTTPYLCLVGPSLGSFGVNFMTTNSCRILAA